ncbi:hypothetical protein P4283_19240 [Bacillus thuringiensis]|nr:hypothetical protein [Bacillus thuringiensis]
MQNISNNNYPQNPQWLQNELQQIRGIVNQLSQAEQTNVQKLGQLQQKCNHLTQIWGQQGYSSGTMPISNIHPQGNINIPTIYPYGHSNI